MAAIGGCLVILLVVAVFAAMWAIWRYNNLVSLRNQVANGWRQIDVQLKRRHDLIPNLVSAVKGEMQFEQDTLEKVIQARNSAVSARGVADAADKESALSQTLGRLFALAENYPNLKADAQFARLMDELSGTENRLAQERMRYNDRVKEYETMRRQFPSNVTAKMFGFKEYPYFEAPPAAQAAPKVDFKK